MVVVVVEVVVVGVGEKRIGDWRVVGNFLSSCEKAD